MKFEFKAFTRDGELKEGIISAENKETALRILQEQELLVTYLTEVKTRFKVLFQKINLKDIYIFTKQLSYLIKARTPLDEAIKTLSETTSNHYLRSVLIEIYNNLISGISFSQALSYFPNVFDSYYIRMIKIGESVGNLDEILNYLSEHLSSQIRFKNRLVQASIYPIFVLILFIVILFALFYFIIPQITKLFIENNIPMPLITRIFNFIAGFLLKFGPMLLVILGFLIYYFYEYFQTKEGKVIFFKFVSNLPVFGNLVKDSYSAQFLESFYYLQKGGVPIIEALEIVKNSINHPLYESALDYVIEDVKRGSPLSQSLNQFPELFSNLITEGIKTAEKTGQLSEIVFTVYNFYNDAVESQLANLSEIIQPILIVVLGIGLGLLEASLLIPLLNLTKYIQSF